MLMTWPLITQKFSAVQIQNAMRKKTYDVVIKDGSEIETGPNIGI